MDKITLAYLIGETCTAYEHATAIRDDHRQSVGNRLLAAMAVALTFTHLSDLTRRYLFFFPDSGEKTYEEVRDWARLYCTENPDLLAQVEAHLHEQENGGTST